MIVSTGDEDWNWTAFADSSSLVFNPIHPINLLLIQINKTNRPLLGVCTVSATGKNEAA